MMDKTETQIDEIVNQLVKITEYPPSRLCDVEFGVGAHTYTLRYDTYLVAERIARALKELVRESIRRVE